MSVRTSSIITRTGTGHEDFVEADPERILERALDDEHREPEGRRKQTDLGGKHRHDAEPDQIGVELIQIGIITGTVISMIEPASMMVPSSSSTTMKAMI